MFSFLHRPSRRMLAILALLGGSACPPATPNPVDEPVVPDPNPPEKVAVSGSLVPATGLSAGDFDFFDGVSDEPTTVGADGAFAGEASGRRSGVLFAAPRDGTPSASRVAAGNGLYMTPALGVARIVAKDGGYEVATEGSAAMDATTTALSMLLMHPGVYHPWPGVQQEQARWMVDRARKAWPAFSQLVGAFDSAMAGGRDVETDAALSTALAACFTDVVSRMPPFEPIQPEAAALSQALDGESVPYAIAKVDVAVSALTEDAADAESIELKPTNKVGTALDYLYVVHKLDPKYTTDGLDSPVFSSPNPYVLRDTVSKVTAGFVQARSYWSYLDVVGNTLTKITGLIGDGLNLTPDAAFELEPVALYEVRFFSGGFLGGNSEAAYTFASTNFSREVRGAFRHNVATAVVETIGVIPGAEAVLGEETGTAVLTAAVQQTFVELDALLNSKPAREITGDDLYGLVFNVCKSTVDTFVAKITETSATQGRLRKAFEFIKKGGAKTFKVLMSVPGKIAKGGSLANRAFRLARPDSIMEYYVVAVGHEPTNRFSFQVITKMDGRCLNEHGNNTMVGAEGTIKTTGTSFAVTEIIQDGSDLGEFIMRHVVVKGAPTGVVEGMTVVFTEPTRKYVRKDVSAIEFQEWEWLGYERVDGAYETRDGTWVHDSQDGRMYSTSTAWWIGAEFTAIGKSEYREVINTDSGELVTRRETKTHNYKVTFQ